MPFQVTFKFHHDDGTDEYPNELFQIIQTTAFLEIIKLESMEVIPFKIQNALRSLLQKPCEQINLHSITT
jgi:hypothetical protein